MDFKCTMCLRNQQKDLAITLYWMQEKADACTDVDVAEVFVGKK